jgi:hypothetical protein
LGNSPNKRTIAPFIVIGLYTLSDIIVIIVLAITDSRYNATPDLITRVLLPLLLIPIIGFIAVMVQRIRKKKEEKWHQTENDDLLVDDEAVEEVRKEIKLVLEPEVFQGDLESQTCSLCNKAVKEGHIILTCPRCSSLFHHDHLLNWLKDNPLCPVCDEDL